MKLVSLIIIFFSALVSGFLGLMLGAWLGGNNLLGFSNYETAGILFGLIGLLLGAFLGWKISVKI